MEKLFSSKNNVLSQIYTKTRIMINLLTERIIYKRGYEIMTVKQREMKIEALMNDLKVFGDDDLKRLLGFVEGMKVGISKREAKKQVLNN